MPASISSESPSAHVSAAGPSCKRSKDSRIEVVAFDSTFIEVTTDIEDILENLSDRFGGTMVVEQRHDAPPPRISPGARLTIIPDPHSPRASNEMPKIKKSRL